MHVPVKTEMETELVFEMLAFNSTLTRLITQENFVTLELNINQELTSKIG
jgi:hypothetical protein